MKTLGAIALLVVGVFLLFNDWPFLGILLILGGCGALI